MKTFKLLFVTFVILGLWFATGWTQPDRGILVMAHGGTKRWNDVVNECVKKANLVYPTRIFFGMGCTKKESEDLAQQIQQLEKQGTRSIVVVPLAVSSYSEVYRQWRYLLGLETEPGFDAKLLAEMMHHTHGAMGTMDRVTPVTHHLSVHFPPALDDDSVVSEILVQRAWEISLHPSTEAVIIVAHGPNQDKDNQRWMDNLQRITSRVQKQGSFQSVEGATLRDDAPPWVREKAVQSLRDRIVQLDKSGSRVLIVPLLIAPGGIEDKITSALQGLHYTFNAKTLLPDSKMAEWIRQRSTQPI